MATFYGLVTQPTLPHGQPSIHYLGSRPLTIYFQIRRITTNVTQPPPHTHTLLSQRWIIRPLPFSHCSKIPGAFLSLLLLSFQTQGNSTFLQLPFGWTRVASSAQCVISRVLGLSTGLAGGSCEKSLGLTWSNPRIEAVWTARWLPGGQLFWGVP